MKGTIRATVKWGAFPQKEKRFVKGTPQRVIKAWKARTLALMMKRSRQPERHGKPGTLTKDALTYYPLVRHLADGKKRPYVLRPTLDVLGDRPRHMITREDIMRLRSTWFTAGVKPKTINNRISALRNLYHVLDGDDATTPCDGLKPLASVKEPPRTVTPEILNTVLDQLEVRGHAFEARHQGRAGSGRPGGQHAFKDRARLMVLAATGKRPIEVGRAKPSDVDLRRRVWLTRDAKGGFSPGLYLNDDMLLAWNAFIVADAWGPIPDHFARRLQDAGWPRDIDPYHLRHMTWITASERGIDLADVQAGAGHKRIDTTRRHYVPVLNSRMQKMSETLDGRFGWQARLAPQESHGKPH
jgi:integrase